MEKAWEGQNDLWYHPKIMSNGGSFGSSISAIFHNESGYWVWTGRLSGDAGRRPCYVRWGKGKEKKGQEKRRRTRQQ
jgi:hypothetical protein